jgi:hypothetical protein
LLIPLKTVNELNRHEHFRTRHNRSVWQRDAIAYALRASLRPFVGVPVTVTLTRIAPSSGLDAHDGLPSSMKFVVDALAELLGEKNDRDPRYAWRYGQERGPYGVRVEIDPLI